VLLFHLPEAVCCLHAALVSLKGTHLHVANGPGLDDVCSSRSALRNVSEMPLLVLLVLNKIAVAQLAYLVGGNNPCLSLAGVST
jgi:hypothetical protein